jgi:hemerythrin-like metal-binding protein
MSIIKWSKSLEIGIKHIDDQHHYLINLINELQIAVEYNKGNEIVLPLLDKLHEYAESHFKVEEALLEENEFPGKVDHVKEHDEFIARLAELKTDYLSDIDDLTLNTRNFVLSWFFNHIRLNDMEYKAYLDQKAKR